MNIRVFSIKTQFHSINNRIANTHTRNMASIFFFFFTVCVYYYTFTIIPLYLMLNASCVSRNLKKNFIMVPGSLQYTKIATYLCEDNKQQWLHCSHDVTKHIYVFNAKAIRNMHENDNTKNKKKNKPPIATTTKQ